VAHTGADEYPPLRRSTDHTNPEPTLAQQPSSHAPTLVIDRQITGADAPGLCARAQVLLLVAGGGQLVCDVAGLPRAHLGAVDALARLQLAARRGGCRLILRGVSVDLADLLALCGLDLVLGGGRAHR
jgi:anti-anti-sigma regulatory factor